jgi:hypothetical protein
MRNFLLSDKNPQRGKKQTPERIRNRSNALLKLNTTAIYQFSKEDGSFIKKWNNLATCADTLGINRSLICGVLKGYKQMKTAGGYIFSNNPHLSTEEFEKRTQVAGTKVDQLTLEGEFVKTWNNRTEAGNSTGLKRANTNILFCCQGKRSTCAGYKWRFHNK